MTATTYSSPQQEHHSSSNLYNTFSANPYDSDEGGPRDSPLMKAHIPKIAPSPSPPPDIPRAQIQESSGDAVLVSHLDNGRHPEIAHAAGREGLPEDTTSLDSPQPLDIPSRMTHPFDRIYDHGRAQARDSPESGYALSPVTSNESHGYGRGPLSATSPASTTSAVGGSLQNLAANASQLLADGPGHPSSQLAHDISVETKHLSIHDDRRPMLPGVETLAPRDRSRSHNETENSFSPNALPTPASQGLPSMHDSPRSESRSNCLPSIRSTLAGLAGEGPRHGNDVKAISPSLSVGLFSRSPPTTLPPISSVAGPSSPPISPHDGMSRSLPSPHPISANASPYFYANPHSGRRLTESSHLDHGGGTHPLAPSRSQNRMSIDDITNSSQSPSYVCNFSGCTAPPFQTQYLLNSHANVHSSARPHYCPVPGCARGEGGRGFKRKNEMIRHGLVHESPGYVCPFCPAREHKYPRPDNLQRHVRVHHPERDKDDPLLREVLAQRADGPSRGRRRRGT